MLVIKSHSHLPIHRYTEKKNFIKLGTFFCFTGYLINVKAITKFKNELFINKTKSRAKNKAMASISIKILNRNL